MENLSNYIIPFLVLFIIIYGLYKHVDIYSSFLHGAKEGIELSISILPSLLAMILSVNVLLSSNIIGDIFKSSNLSSIVPLMLTRPISGNASYMIMIDIIKKFGPDSYLGSLASVMQGSTDTTIYVLAIYFGSIGVKKIKYALKVGLLADLIAIICSFLAINLIFH